MEVTLYSDGSSRGNPGPGGYGTILRYTAPSGAVHEKEFSAGFSCTTNNRMELLGCIVVVEFACQRDELVVILDMNSDAPPRSFTCLADYNARRRRAGLSTLLRRALLILFGNYRCFCGISGQRGISIPNVPI